MKKYLPFFCIAIIFFLVKLSSFGIRLSDTNIYFYTGYQLLQGKILYKDIFFTNFPLLPYISSLYFFLLGGSLKLFYLTPVIEVLVTTLIIYKIIIKQTQNIFLSTLSASLYAFSFIVLSTSDHQTGVFAASFFAVLSYYFFTSKRFILQGIFVALALLTKAYFLPIFITYLFIFFYKREGEWWKFFLGFLTTTFIILLPTLFLAPKEFIQDVISYSLTRSQGVEKTRLIWFFIIHDLILFSLLIWNIVRVKKNLFFGILSIMGILFIFLYKDVYYLYLNFLIPFLCLSLPSLLQYLKQKASLRLITTAVVIGFFLLINLFVYLRSYATLQKLDNISEIVAVVKKENPPFLYGTNDIAPALSYLTDKPLLGNVIDTNPNIYRKGYLSASEMTKLGVQQNALFIGHGMHYPQANIRQDITDEIFDPSQLSASCSIKGLFPVKMEGTQNRLVLFRC